MTEENGVAYKIANGVLKKTLKNERTKSWRSWAESLGPRTSTKEIFRRFRQLSNFRVPNQPNVMFQSPNMVRDFLEKLCKNNNSTETLPKNSDTENPFSMEELLYVLSQKKNSAPGLDGIKYGDISRFPINVKMKFLELVNEVWASQDIPSTLKKILMVLIPKPGRDMKLLNSHRPIALLSVYLKIINSMIKVRLEEFIGRNETINENHYGFVKHRSSIDCLNYLISLINEKQNDGLHVMAIFLDLENAFNNVNPSKLQSILNKLGVPQQFVSWIVKSYKEREVTVETVGGDIKDQTSSGIPQGDVLSPIIFLLYTTPLFELCVEGSTMLQFADDLCLITWNENVIEATATLQKAISEVMKLIRSLDMDVNPNKSKAIWFSADPSVYTPAVSIKGTNVKFERSVKFLGIHLDENLNFQKHIGELIGSIERKINIIKMFSGSKWGGHPETMLAILRSVVRGKIEYGSSIYGGANQRWLNKITVSYNKGLRLCLRSLKSTPINALEVEAGSIPLSLRRDYLAQREVLRVFERKLPLMQRFRDIRENLDDYGLTFLEKNYLKIAGIIDQACNAKEHKFPDSLLNELNQRNQSARKLSPANNGNI